MWTILISSTKTRQCHFSRAFESFLLSSTVTISMNASSPKRDNAAFFMHVSHGSKNPKPSLVALWKYEPWGQISSNGTLSILDQCNFSPLWQKNSNTIRDCCCYPHTNVLYFLVISRASTFIFCSMNWPKLNALFYLSFRSETSRYWFWVWLRLLVWCARVLSSYTRL